MAEYISREEAIKELREVYEYEYPTASGDFDEYASHDVPNVLRNMPAADVQPVKRGEWETWGYIFHGIEWVRCSRCGKPADVSYFKLLEGKIEPATLSICGCCGADLRGEGNDA